VVFLESLPLTPVRLEADVMTPHYAPYYKDIKSVKPPADWYDPVPIPFLTVAPGQRFLFAVLPRRLSSQAHVEDARRALAEALANLGVGAKTAVGYGRFEATPASDASATVSPPAESQPHHNVGDVVTAIRIEDPKGRGRLWFQADDGFGGVVTRGEAPPVEPGQTLQLQVAAVLGTQGYNFSLPLQKQSTSQSRKASSRPSK